MSFKHVDMESAMRRLADRRIEEAMKEGKFDNLAGMGKPLDFEPMPAEENARMTWWMLRILKNSDFAPEEIRWRKAIDHLKSRLSAARDESHVREIVRQINEIIHKLNTLGTNALSCDFAPLDLETEVTRWNQRNLGTTDEHG